MAKPSKQQPTVWRTAAAVESKPIFIDGDIYAPLRRLRDRYLNKVVKLLSKAGDPDKNDDGRAKAVHYYEEAARRVHLLIPNRFEEALAETPVVDMPASVIGANLA